jgi:hypothetical protein
MNPLIQLKTTSSILVALACFGLSPVVQAQLPPPPPDGGYPGANTAEGDGALFNLTTGTGNTAIGNSALFSNRLGSGNTATGIRALASNVFGLSNTAIGAIALASNDGVNNTAIGASALSSNTFGNNNTATGVDALETNGLGGENTANGAFALFLNNNGNNNTATGVDALFRNITGDNNTATGAEALVNNTASNNTAIGYQALNNNRTAANNTATGANALLNNRTGNFNTANGGNALSNNTSGSSNIAVGINAGRMLTTGSNNIDIGNVGVAGESNKIRIGTRTIHTDTFIAGIFGAPVINGTQVFINPNGRLGTMLSSDRFKEAIKPMNKASEAILALQPVTFRYKPDLDPDGIPQFGLIAEQVEKVNPDLVVRDDKCEIYTVRYEAVNAMLLNEFLKEHRKVEEQSRKAQEQEATIVQLKKDFRATVAEQQEEIKALGAGLKKQAAQIQKVSAQIEASKPAPQVVNNNQ